MPAGSFCKTIACCEPGVLSASTHIVLISTVVPVRFMSVLSVAPCDHGEGAVLVHSACTVIEPTTSPARSTVNRHEQSDGATKPREIDIESIVTVLLFALQVAFAEVIAPVARGDGIGGTVPPAPLLGTKPGLADDNNGMAIAANAPIDNFIALVMLLSFLYLCHPRVESTTPFSLHQTNRVRLAGRFDSIAPCH